MFLQRPLFHVTYGAGGFIHTDTQNGSRDEQEQEEEVVVVVVREDKICIDGPGRHGAGRPPVAVVVTFGRLIACRRRACERLDASRSLWGFESLSLSLTLSLCPSLDK